MKENNVSRDVKETIEKILEKSSNINLHVFLDPLMSLVGTDKKVVNKFWKMVLLSDHNEIVMKNRFKLRQFDDLERDQFSKYKFWESVDRLVMILEMSKVILCMNGCLNHESFD